MSSLFSRGIVVLAAVVLMCSTVTVVGEEDPSTEDVFCPSLPSELSQKFPFLPNNPDTYSCSRCTQYNRCAWCDKGKATDIYVAGIKLEDVVLEGFCWAGDPFTLVNNTFTTGSTLKSSFAINCDGPPKWRQCKLSGVVFLSLTLSALLLFCCCCCCACLCTCAAYCRKHKKSQYSRI